ncbi:hypothetical protein [Neobacillus piezotolerans]|uniref:hypothetical protein n=1 Tax=Neobacillus piezotolerans TaxID=2259171 RepID=UPI0015F1398A|nr:hypothetical protein [Neobacillus piezotolerans]
MREENILHFFDKLLNDKLELEILNLIDQNLNEEAVLKTLLLGDLEGENDD